MDGVRIADDGQLLDVVLDAEKDGNRISEQMARRIIATLDAITPETKLVRIRANGVDFCRGRVSAMPPNGSKITAAQLRNDVTDPPLALYAAISNVPVPVLCAVQGAVHGMGCAIASASDIVLAADDASFRIPEMERGVPPLLVMTTMLGKVPSKVIFHLALSCQSITAEDARQAGLVSKIVKQDQLDAEVFALTKHLTDCSTVSLRTAKGFMQHALRMDPAGASTLATNMLANAHSTRYAP